MRCDLNMFAIYYLRTFKNFEELAFDYESGELHPGDLKPALAKTLNLILQVFDIILSELQNSSDV